MQCFVYSPLHVHLRVTHALSYGNKGHLYDCACVRRGPSLYSRCTRVRAQTLQHERQGKTLDYSPIEYYTSNACIICAGCCSMLCNCAEGLHFSAFHWFGRESIRSFMPSKHSYFTLVEQFVECVVTMYPYFSRLLVYRPSTAIYDIYYSSR